MRKYKAYATISYDLVCEFELDDDSTDPLWHAKHQLDGSDFTEIENSSDWNLWEVQEIK